MFYGSGYKSNFQQHYRLNHKQEAVSSWIVSIPVRPQMFRTFMVLTVFYFSIKSCLREETGHQSSVPAQQVGHLESAVSQLHLELREAKRMCEDKVRVESCVSAVPVKLDTRIAERFWIPKDRLLKASGNTYSDSALQTSLARAGREPAVPLEETAAETRQ